MAQCKGRYADKELSFTNSKVFYTERRCIGKATEDELCSRCCVKQKIPFNAPLQIDQFQGKVGEDYFKRSVLYGSPWFLRKTHDEGFEVSLQDLRLAKQAQREAVMGTQMPRKKKEDVPVAAQASQVEKPVPAQEKPKKPRAPRKKKEEAPPPAPSITVAAPIALAVESAEEPLEALEVIKIPVTLKTIHGKQVWYDSKKSKVYEVKKDKSVGKYLGRFDSAEDKIADFPDSDVDV
jgi:hypothetical protein